MECQKNDKKTNWGKRLLRVGIGVGIGALLGYAYFYFVGCPGGTCSITSNPVNTVIYGMLIGGVVAFK